MAKYRKKPVVIEAVQWNKDGDHSEVETMWPELIFSLTGSHYYLDCRELRATAWLPVHECSDEEYTSLSEDEKREYAVLPFAFWKVKDGEHIRVDGGNTPEHQQLIDKAITTMRRDDSPFAVHSAVDEEIKPWGRIKTLESGHGYHTVTPGDFIITGVHGELYPCKPDIFHETYEAV